jgi:hypothetical protein
MQPLYKDDQGTVRFKGNTIVRHLLDKGGIDLNHLAIKDFPQNDWEQFYQLIGYSLSGYHELSRVSDESALGASKAARVSLGIASDVVIGCREAGCEVHCGVEKE